MTATFQMHTDDLTTAWQESVIKLFYGKYITVTISETMDETDYLFATEANRKHLMESLEQVKNGQTVTFTLEEFNRIYGNPEGDI
jgi:hypothetical protein